MSKESTEALMDRLQQPAEPKPDTRPYNAPPPLRDELTGKIKAFENFQTALLAGTFPGSACVHVGAMLNLFRNERDACLAEYEKESLTHPEWGTKPEAKA